MAADIYVATTSGIVAGADGREYQLSAGTTLVRAGHPLLEGHADMFKPVHVHHDWTPEAPVEQATAAPGEKRNVRRTKPADGTETPEV